MKKSILGSCFLIGLVAVGFGQAEVLIFDATAPPVSGLIYDAVSGLVIPASVFPDQSFKRYSSWDCTIGHFVFSNVPVPTRLGSADGSLAGPGIWAQMLLGESPESLLPVGSPKEHFGYGYVAGGAGALLFIPGKANIRPWPYVQMVAWDGVAWGTELAGVPPDQLGKTDVVQVDMTSVCSVVPPMAPPFTEPAIVPPIPEPSIWILSLVGGGWLILVQCWRARGACRSG